MAVCYRHPDRETGVSCSNCGNPICPDCMTATPVGMRCPDCSRQKTQVHTMRTMHVDPTVTFVLIGINVLLFFGASFGGGGTETDLALWGPAIDPGQEYWRLVTAGFMHAGLIHILLNMYILYWLGTMLEPVLGHVRFVSLYFAALLSGSFGALALSADRLTVGASGAVFGLMAAAFVMQRARGVDPMRSGIGPLILLNLVITFLPGFNISVGGHIGGLVGGGLCALAIEGLARRRIGGRGLARVLPVAACVLVGLVALAGALSAAGSYA